MTERTLCVWFPDWPLRRPDAPRDRACLVVDDAGVVTASDAVAADAGVRIGMRRREAEALCPAAVTLAADPTAEASAFEPVVGAVEAVVPRVEVSAPGLLFVPAAGAVRYYGGEDVVMEQVAAAVGAVAPGAGIGLADGPFAARAAAASSVGGSPRVVADTAAFLAAFDVSVLGVAEIADTFRWLGVTTLGHLAALPRAAVASRFGPAGLEAHRIASGEDRRVRPRPIPEEIVAEERFDPPIGDTERAAFAARAAARRLTEALGPWGGIPHRILVEVEAAEGPVRSRVWRSADPFSEAEVVERVRWQLGAWVEGGGVPGGISRLLLAPADRSDRGRQLRLDEDAGSDLEASRAVARAQALLGPDAVLGAHPQGGRDPADRVQWHRWGEAPGVPEHDPAAPWPGRIPHPAPALTVPEPRVMEVEWDGGMPVRVRLGSRWEPVLGWAGPWRRTGRWWQGEGPADRYQIVTSAGAFLCEIHEGRCLLQAVYD
jgi:protein ImuB